MDMRQKGVIDSGVGGLSIWKEITTLLPSESTIYIADQKNCPYGLRSPEEIYRLSKRLVSYLLEQDVKLIVLACNTITVSCLARLREEFPKIAIIGTVPVIKTAVEKSKTRQIGVLSTERTAQSEYQQQLIKDFAGDCLVLNQGTNELVPFVERGEVEGKKVTGVLNRVLLPFQEQEVDVLALGCSHSPFLREVMQAILGEEVIILDSGAAIARQVARVLKSNQAEAQATKTQHMLLTTADVQTFRTVAKKLLGGTMTEEIMILKVAI